MSTSNLALSATSRLDDVSRMSPGRQRNQNLALPSYCRHFFLFMSFRQIKREVQKITKLNEWKCFSCGNSFPSRQHLLNHNQFEKSCKLKTFRPLSEERSTKESDFGHFTWEDYNTASAEDAVFVDTNPLLSLQKFLVVRGTAGSVSPLVVNKVYDVLTDRREDVDWIDYLDIYYMITTTCVSMTEADEILRTFSRILHRKNVHVILPKSCRVIRKSIQQAVLSKFIYVNFKYALPAEWFTPKYAAMDSVASGHYVNIMQVLAEMLIDIPKESFHFVPFDLRNDNGERMYREPGTAHVFKEYCKLVKEKCGEDAYPLLIVVNGDSLILNKTGDYKITYEHHVSVILTSS